MAKIFLARARLHRLPYKTTVQRMPKLALIKKHLLMINNLNSYDKFLLKQFNRGNLLKLMYSRDGNNFQSY